MILSSPLQRFFIVSSLLRSQVNSTSSGFSVNSFITLTTQELDKCKLRSGTTKSYVSDELVWKIWKQFKTKSDYQQLNVDRSRVSAQEGYWVTCESLSNHLNCTHMETSIGNITHKVLLKSLEYNAFIQFLWSVMNKSSSLSSDPCSPQFLIRRK